MIPDPPIITVDPIHPEPEIIQRAAEMVKSGGVIVFPTYAVYGLGADAQNLSAVEKVFTIKQRPLDNPLLVLADTMEGIRRLVKQIPESARKLMENIWPGGVTLVFEAHERVLPKLTGGTGKIGIRMPEHPVAKALCRSINGPITATSANISGTPGWDDVKKADPGVTGKLDLILDAGALSGGLGSTIVDVTADPPEILREGRVSSAFIDEVLGKRI